MTGVGGGDSSTIGTNFLFRLGLSAGSRRYTLYVHLNMHRCQGSVIPERCAIPLRRWYLTRPVAEGVGFEPTRARALPVFKTGAINRSTTPPGRPGILCHRDQAQQ